MVTLSSVELHGSIRPRPSPLSPQLFSSQALTPMAAWSKQLYWSLPIRLEASHLAKSFFIQPLVLEWTLPLVAGFMTALPGILPETSVVFILGINRQSELPEPADTPEQRLLKLEAVTQEMSIRLWELQQNLLERLISEHQNPKHLIVQQAEELQRILHLPVWLTGIDDLPDMLEKVQKEISTGKRLLREAKKGDEAPQLLAIHSRMAGLYLQQASGHLFRVLYDLEKSLDEGAAALSAVYSTLNDLQHHFKQVREQRERLKRASRPKQTKEVVPDLGDWVVTQVPSGRVILRESRWIKASAGDVSGNVREEKQVAYSGWDEAKRAQEHAVYQQRQEALEIVQRMGVMRRLLRQLKELQQAEDVTLHQKTLDELTEVASWARGRRGKIEPSNRRAGMALARAVRSMRKGQYESASRTVFEALNFYAHERLPSLTRLQRYKSDLQQTIREVHRQTADWVAAGEHLMSLSPATREERWRWLLKAEELLGSTRLPFAPGLAEIEVGRKTIRIAQSAAGYELVQAYRKETQEIYAALTVPSFGTAFVRQASEVVLALKGEGAHRKGGLGVRRAQALRLLGDWINQIEREKAPFDLEPLHVLQRRIEKLPVELLVEAKDKLLQGIRIRTLDDAALHFHRALRGHEDVSDLPKIQEELSSKIIEIFRTLAGPLRQPDLFEDNDLGESLDMTWLAERMNAETIPPTEQALLLGSAAVSVLGGLWLHPVLGIAGLVFVILGFSGAHPKAMRWKAGVWATLSVTIYIFSLAWTREAPVAGALTTFAAWLGLTRLQLDINRHRGHLARAA